MREVGGPLLVSYWGGGYEAENVLLMVLGGVLGEESRAGRRHVGVPHVGKDVPLLIHNAHPDLVRTSLEAHNLRHLLSTTGPK